MELCTPRAISNLPHRHNHGGGGSRSCIQLPSLKLRWKQSSPQKHISISPSSQGLQSYKFSSLRSTASDETSSVTNQYVKDEPEVITFEDTKPSDEKEYEQITINEAPLDEPVGVITSEDREPTEGKEDYGETSKDEAFGEDSNLDVQEKIIEFFNQLNLKFDSKDSYSILLFGSTAVAALWLTTAVVGAIDSIPVFPELMKVVGLGYTVWFGTRYLIFKRNRDELAAKIEELKQQVLGSKDE